MQKGLERYGRRFYRLRGRRVFRDKTEVGIGEQLQPAARAGLAGSRYLILLANESSAGSRHVQSEVAWWLANRSLDSLLVVLTGGEIKWQNQAFLDPASTALPPQLIEYPLFEFIHSDQRWARDTLELDSDPRFRNMVIELTAKLDGVPKNQLIGTHARQRRLLGIATSTVIGILVTALVVTGASLFSASGSKNSERERAMLATSRLLAAEAERIGESDPDTARQLLAEAYRLGRTPQLAGAIIRSATWPRQVFSRGLARKAVFSPNGRLMAVVSDQGLQIVDVATARILAQRGDQRGYAGVAAFSADGSRLAIGSRNDEVILYDIENPADPKLLWTKSRTDSIVYGLFFVGNEIIIKNATSDVTVLDVQGRELSGPDPKFRTNGIAFDARTKMLATKSGDGHVEFSRFDDAGRRELLASPALPGTIGSISPVAPMFTTLEGSGVRLWDIFDPATPRHYATIPAEGPEAEDTVFSPDGETLAVLGASGEIRLWDVSDPLTPKAGELLRGQSGVLRKLAYSPDGSLLVSTGLDGREESASGEQERGSVRIWPVDGFRRGSFSTVLSTLGQDVHFSPDGRLLFVSQPARVWSVGSAGAPAAIPELNVSQAATFDFASGHDGYRILRSYPPLVIRLRENGTPAEALPGPSEWSGQLVPGPDGRLLAMDNEDAYLWRFGTDGAPQRRGRMTGTKYLKSASFSPHEGRFLATVSREGQVSLWDCGEDRKPELIGTMDSERKFRHVVFLAESLILAVDESGTVTTWDVQDRNDPRLIDTKVGHSGVVSAVSASADGRRIVTSGDDGVAKVWDLDDHGDMVEIWSSGIGGRYASMGAALSPDGSMLAMSTLRGVRVVGIDIDDEVTNLCRYSEVISESTWKQYVPGEQYDPPCSS
ncbi:WD40 repeat [Nocardia amikacinitolerans]|nr:WD40 repeat [Nocardia amikacinitolerans]